MLTVSSFWHAVSSNSPCALLTFSFSAPWHHWICFRWLPPRSLLCRESLTHSRTPRKRALSFRVNALRSGSPCQTEAIFWSHRLYRAAHWGTTSALQFLSDENYGESMHFFMVLGAASLFPPLSLQLVPTSSVDDFANSSLPWLSLR